MSSPSLLSLLVAHWQPALPLDLGASLAVAIYVWGSRRTRSPWPARRTLAFLGGIASVVLALQSGIGAYDDRLLSLHMVQHMLLLVLAPLLLLAGQPVTLALRVSSPAGRQWLGRALKRTRALTRPVVCLVAFDLAVLGTHLPLFYDAALRHPLLHDAEHVIYLIAGLWLYWPLIGAEPAPSRRLGGLGRLIYMLAAMPVMALIGAYLNRHPSVVYAAYGPTSHALGVSPLADQAQAGAIMWVAGSVAMTAVGIFSALQALSEEERRQQAAERDAHGAVAAGGSS